MRLSQSLAEIELRKKVGFRRIMVNVQNIF